MEQINTTFRMNGSVVQAVQDTLKANPASDEDAARQAGINRHAYVFIRKLLILRDHALLSEDRRETIRKALQQVDETRQIRPSIRTAGTIVEAFWPTVVVHLPNRPVPKRKRPGTTRPNRRFEKFPADRSVIDEVQKAMAVYPGNIQMGAKAISLDYRVYSLMSKLFVLRDQEGVPQEHRDTINAALQSIEAQRSVHKAEAMTAEIVEQHWQSKGNDKARRRLEQTLIHIGESCESTVDMEIPKGLTQKEVREAVLTLNRSIEFVCRLTRRLMGEEQ